MEKKSFFKKQWLLVITMRVLWDVAETPRPEDQIQYSLEENKRSYFKKVVLSRVKRRGRKTIMHEGKNKKSTHRFFLLPTKLWLLLRALVKQALPKNEEVGAMRSVTTFGIGKNFR